MNKENILIAGYGSAGQYLVDFILKDHRIQNIKEIHIMSRKSREDVQPRLEISRIASNIAGRYIPMMYHSVDFDDIDRMADIISLVDPSVIVYTGRFASGIKYGSYSYPNNIGYGVWMPMSFPYIYNLMKAVRMCNSRAKVINTSFPDGVNYLLSQVGLDPFCGAGNVNHLVPRIKRAIVNHYCHINPGDLDVSLSCAHYVNTYVSKEGTDKGCMSLLNVRVNHWTNRSGELSGGLSTPNNDYFKSWVYQECKDSSASGQVRNQMIATDCSELIRILTGSYSKEGEYIHIPGFKGLPGGTRVNVNDQGDLYVDIRDWDLQTINTVNIDGLRHDGVVVEGSKLFFTDEVVRRMKEVFDLDYPRYLEIEDIRPFAEKIREKLVGY